MIEAGLIVTPVQYVRDDGVLDAPALTNGLVFG